MPENIYILVRDVCGDKIYTRDDGKPLYDKIAETLNGGKSVTVDFSGKEIASESFLDEAIVEHFMRPLVSHAHSLITLKNVFPHDQTLLQRIFEYRKMLAHKTEKKRPGKVSTPDHSVSLIKDAPYKSRPRK